MFYTDTCLTHLISEGLKHNPDVQIALDNVRLARTSYRMARGAMLPGVDAMVRTTVDRFGEYTMNGVGNDDTNRSETLPPDKKLPDPYPEFFAGLTFNWEANVWGRLSNRRRAAQARLMAIEEVRHGVITQLVSTIAENYYALVGLDQERHVLQENLRLQEMGLELVNIQKIGGRANQLAVDQFEAQLLNTRSRLLQVEQQILAAEAGLNRLIGRYAQPLDRWTIARYDTIETVGAGSSEQLLYYRPDIRQAELNVRAAHADVAVARAAFYPGLSLSAAAGFSAFDVSKWFLSPGSAAYSLGAGLTAPVFHRGRIKALYEGATASQHAALMQYQQTLLTAYCEVYVVLHNLLNLQKQIKIKEEEATVQRRAFINSNDMFSVGYASYLEVITAQRRLLDVELELANLKKELLQNHAILYRALGGGWR
jgi:NodT family efflux transporter outer membrane factor (OMF) lipoprotein